MTISPTAAFAQVVSHEGQHVRDLQTLAAHAVYKRGKITVSDEYNPTTYTLEDRAYETEQFLNHALKVDHYGTFQGKTYYVYKASWAEADRKTLMSNMQAAREAILKDGYKVTKQNQGPRQID